MDEIRNALIRGEGNKLSKKEYKFAIDLERKRLCEQLVFLTFISFVIGGVFFVSMYWDIKEKAYR